MQRLSRYYLLIALPLILLCGFANRIPLPLLPEHPKGEMFDRLPEVLSTLPRGVCRLFSCRPVSWNRERYIDTSQGHIVYNAPVVNESDADCDSSRWGPCGDIYVLAWQQWKVANTKFGGSAQFSEDHVLLLYHPHYDSAAAADEWKLLYIFRPAKYPDWMLEHAPIHTGISARTRVTYSSKPTNADIYSAVQGWNANPEVLFGFDLTKSSSGKGMRAFKGIEFEMAEGEVYAKTWEAVIGEKPTKAF